MRSTARSLATAFAAALLAAPALRAQTPTTGTPGAGSTAGSATQDTSMRGMNHGGMNHGAAGQGAAGGGSLVARVDSVNAAAKSGLTSVPATVAVGLVRGIETQLRASRNASLRSIAGDLRALRTELSRSTVNGPRVGAILGRVGPKVTRVANTQSGALATTLRELGGELTTAGRSLRSGAAAGATSGR